MKSFSRFYDKSAFFIRVFFVISVENIRRSFLHAAVFQLLLLIPPMRFCAIKIKHLFSQRKNLKTKFSVKIFIDLIK